MKSEALTRLSFSTICAVLGAVALMGTCGSLRQAVLWWLVYSVACGVVLNTKAGEKPKQVALLAILPGVAPSLVAAFLWLFSPDDFCFSLATSTSERFALLLIALAAISWFGVFVFSFSRDVILRTAKLLSYKGSAQKLEKMEATLRTLIGVVLAVLLLLKTLQGGS